MLLPHSILERWLFEMPIASAKLFCLIFNCLRLLAILFPISALLHSILASPRQASINKSTHVGQPVFSVLFALFSLAGDSPPASKRTKIPRKSKAVRCEAVLPEQKCSQTRKRPQRILCVFSRALTQYEGISARQNRVCPCQSTQAYQ